MIHWACSVPSQRSRLFNQCRLRLYVTTLNSALVSSIQLCHRIILASNRGPVATRHPTLQRPRKDHPIRIIPSNPEHPLHGLDDTAQKPGDGIIRITGIDLSDHLADRGLLDSHVLAVPGSNHGIPLGFCNTGTDLIPRLLDISLPIDSVHQFLKHDIASHLRAVDESCVDDDVTLSIYVPRDGSAFRILEIRIVHHLHLIGAGHPTDSSRDSSQPNRSAGLASKMRLQDALAKLVAH